MKFRFLMLILAFFVHHQIWSQENKNSLFLQTGTSIPFADFGLKKLTYDAGFASPGAFLEIDYFYEAGKFFALNAGFNYSFMNFHKESYQSEYERVLNLQNDIGISAGPYHFLTAMAGPVLKINTGEKMEILFLARTGYTMAIHPNIEVVSQEWGIINTLPRDISQSMGTSIGIKCHVKLREKQKISFGYTMYFMKHNFEDDQTFMKNYYLPVRFQNIGIGWMIQL